MRTAERVKGGSIATALLIIWIHPVALISVVRAFSSPLVVPLPPSRTASLRLDAIRIDEATTSTTTTAEQEQCEHAQQEEDDDPEEDEDWMTARSCFGTKTYWDDVYAGRGDFPADEYSWYYDWNVLQKHIVSTLEQSVDELKKQRILIPGCGNDPLLSTLVRSGFQQLTAQDYSQAAIDRQRDLLREHADPQAAVHLSVSNVLKPLPYGPDSFDLLIDKGLLDAVYLSNDDDGAVVQQAVQNLTQTLRKNGGIFVSVSGVVPAEVRSQVFERLGYKCIRDGSDDLTAGCFIFRKP